MTLLSTGEGAWEHTGQILCPSCRCTMRDGSKFIWARLSAEALIRCCQHQQLQRLCRGGFMLLQSLLLRCKGILQLGDARTSSGLVE